MTMNPNMRVSDIHADEKSLILRRAETATIGSLFAAAFIIVVTFIARTFYE